MSQQDFFSPAQRADTSSAQEGASGKTTSAKRHTRAIPKSDHPSTYDEQPYEGYRAQDGSFFTQQHHADQQSAGTSAHSTQNTKQQEQQYFHYKGWGQARSQFAGWLPQSFAARLILFAVLGVILLTIVGAIIYVVFWLTVFLIGALFFGAIVVLILQLLGVPIMRRTGRGR
ncbi:hypothetical protein [Tengunoibacter tsumagoiensis]|uniref:Uncharacterized protein n=1 Tax=Tengunoibacter tsumagoiensis TaxID=2014871 RepID=A0A401ZVE6_9CHLR|nr:hypothetical protein [Tengunoibacter tsumagoiensis]GCE10871.1 hypothetical protein KTT_07300 [Tengunoibacter tsumagoiensis]